MGDEQAARTYVRALRELTLARVREFLREPEALFWVFGFPVIMTIALGIAFRTRTDEPVVVGVERVAGAAAVAAALETAGGFVVRDVPAAGVERALRDGVVQVVIVPGTPPAYRFDPARAESQVARLAVDRVLQQAAGRRDAFTPREDAVRAVGSRYIDWLVPGLLGMNIMGTGMWSTSFAIVTARTRKLLKRFAATPMPRSAYLLSFVGSRVAFLVAEGVVLVGFAWLAFDVAVHGSLAALGVVSLVGALAFGGIALLVASRARTVEGVSGLLNLVMLPMWVFSGVFFASSNFPDAMQPFVQVLPLTALNDALRGVINDGEPLARLWRELALLTVWGGASFAAAFRLFRWA
ncbi:MAG: ABC transporter permease [Acidobacteria bacterium]|nr:ABC transporter permease [Acidobacteriota bacterium]